MVNELAAHRLIAVGCAAAILPALLAAAVSAPSVVLMMLISVIVVGVELTTSPGRGVRQVAALGIVLAGLVVYLGPAFANGQRLAGIGALLAGAVVATQARAGQRTSQKVLLSITSGYAAAQAALTPSAVTVGLGVVSALAVMLTWVLMVRVDAAFGAGVVRAGGLQRSDLLRGLPAATARPVAVAVVVGVLAALLLPSNPDTGGLDPTAGGAVPAGEGWVTGLSGGAGRPLGPYAGGDLSLGMRGDLPDVSVAIVPQGPRYWRVNVLSDYDGHTLRDAGTELGGAEPTSTPFIGTAVADYQVLPQDGYPGVVLAPGPPVQLDRPAYRVGHLLLDDLDTPYTVSVGGYPDLAAAAAGAVGDPGADPDDDPQDPRWVQLPDTVTPRTRALAAELGAGLDPLSAATAIEAHLRQYTYDLDAPVAPEGADTVDYVLFESRSGFCEHYATAQLVLLRALGIPARVATGFAGGRGQDGVATLTGRDAHAWVEVYVPGAGWVISDPTPPAPPSVLSGRTLLWVVALLVLLIVIGLGWWVYRRRRAGAVTSTGTAAVDPVRLALDRLGSALERAGQPTPPARTLAELAVDIPELSRPLEVAQRHCYRRSRAPRAEVYAAIEQIDAYTARLLVDVQRRAPSAPG